LPSALANQDEVTCHRFSDALVNNAMGCTGPDKILLDLQQIFKPGFGDSQFHVCYLSHGMLHKVA